jgi:site-specific DNA-methyltransferase (adenine-specific)
MKETFLNCDCLSFMEFVPDSYFNIAIVAPPTGGDMPKPSEEYFKELLRISKNQIIWGASHYTSLLPYDSKCWLVWNKLSEDPSYNDCVLAWTSFKSPVKIFTHTYKTDNRIHPYQEPVELHTWALENYAKIGDKILDTHLGSGSSAIAALDFGISEFAGCEINKKYFDLFEIRYANYKATR